MQNTEEAAAQQPKAQKEFIARHNPENNTLQNSLDFTTWYHPEDVQRIVWAIDQLIPEPEKAAYHKPHVFFDLAPAPPLFEACMIFCRDTLEKSNKKYFPFIIKPEMGYAHYTAGILRKDRDGSIKLFFFNPLGYSSADELETAQKRLKLENIACIDGMDVFYSPHKIQDLDKEGDGIVSCGSISILFIQYALANPRWIDSLDQQFVLPVELSQFLHYDLETYQTKLINVRKTHFNLLKNVSDELLRTDVNPFYWPFTEILSDAFVAMRNSVYRYHKDDTEFSIFLNQSLPNWDNSDNEGEIIDPFTGNVSSTTDSYTSNSAAASGRDHYTIHDIEPTLEIAHPLLSAKRLLPRSSVDKHQIQPELKLAQAPNPPQILKVHSKASATALTGSIFLFLGASVGAVLVATGIFSPFGIGIWGGVALAATLGGGSALLTSSIAFVATKKYPTEVSPGKQKTITVSTFAMMGLFFGAALGGVLVATGILAPFGVGIWGGIAFAATFGGGGSLLATIGALVSYKQSHASNHFQPHSENEKMSISHLYSDQRLASKKGTEKAPEEVGSYDPFFLEPSNSVEPVRTQTLHETGLGL